MKTQLLTLRSESEHGATMYFAPPSDMDLDEARALGDAIICIEAENSSKEGLGDSEALSKTLCSLRELGFADCTAEVLLSEMCNWDTGLIPSDMDKALVASRRARLQMTKTAASANQRPVRP